MQSNCVCIVCGVLAVHGSKVGGQAGQATCFAAVSLASVYSHHPCLKDIDMLSPHFQ